jgi:hypothetical protein
MATNNYNDQFELGRIPLKPLAYSSKNLASTNELIVDYSGDNPTYRIYISDKDDVSKLHDLTYEIAQDIINSDISADPSKLKIDLEGVDEPEDLKFLMNFIYKRLIYAENANGFRYDRDITKVLDETSKNTLLTNTDGTIILPVTTTDNVLDKSGQTISDRLANMVSTGINHYTITPEVDSQAEFDITLPYSNYDGYLEIYVDGLLIPEDDYTSTVDEDDNEILVVSLTNNDLINSITTESKIHVVFIYNTLMTGTGRYEKLNGASISNNSISTRKLARVSDSYTFNNKNTVATSAAVYNLYTYVADKLDGSADNMIYALDSSTDNGTIIISTSKDFVNDTEPFIVEVALHSNKLSEVVLMIQSTTTVTTESNTEETTDEGDAAVISDDSDTSEVATTNVYDLVYPDGTRLTRGLSANRVMKLMILNEYNEAVIISSGMNAPKSTRYIYTCADRETDIPYSALDHNTDDLINVYRNGVRLFEDLDYYIDTVNEFITLFERTEKDEKIIFEALS